MPPTIHCVRHGQGFHNVPPGFYNLPDPRLTPEGEAQCLAVKERCFPEQSHISLVTTSPLSRAIQSAAIIFRPLFELGKPVKSILAIPDAQETSDDPCDVGSGVEVLKNACEENHWPVDLALVEEGWNIKRIGGRYSPSSQAIDRRARDVRLYLREQARSLAAAGDEDAHIVLIAHGGFFHYFTEDWEGAEKFPGTGWVNCETRAYTFADGIDNNVDRDAHLVELMDSRRMRGLDYPMLPRDKQSALFEEAMHAWENQGLQNPSKIGLLEEAAMLKGYRQDTSVP